MYADFRGLRKRGIYFYGGTAEARKALVIRINRRSEGVVKIRSTIPESLAIQGFVHPVGVARASRRERALRKWEKPALHLG
jgi:hypothetical protein